LTPRASGAGQDQPGRGKYSVMRAMKSISRSDVALVLIDAAEGITEQDERIVGLAHEAGKGIIIVLNKWDMVEDKEKAYKRFMAEIQQRLKFADYATILTISAVTRQRSPRCSMRSTGSRKSMKNGSQRPG